MRMHLLPKGINIDYSEDLIDAIWEDRPALSDKPAFFLEEKYSGESTASKLERVRKVMTEKGATVHAIASLDDVCWLLNVHVVMILISSHCFSPMPL